MCAQHPVVEAGVLKVTLERSLLPLYLDLLLLLWAALLYGPQGLTDSNEFLVLNILGKYPFSIESGHKS